MMLHAAVDDLGELCEAWHQDLSDALGVPVDPNYRPRVPLGVLPMTKKQQRVGPMFLPPLGRRPLVVVPVMN